MNKGFATILVLLVVVLVSGVGVGWYLSNTGIIPKFTGPATTSQSPTPNVEQPPALPAIPGETTVDENTTWETYKNIKYGYSVEVPEVLAGFKNSTDLYEFQHYDTVTFAGLEESPGTNSRFVVTIRLGLMKSDGGQLDCSTDEECLEEWKKVWEKPGFITGDSEIIYKEGNVLGRKIKGIEFQNAKYPNETKKIYVFKEQHEIWALELTLRNLGTQEAEIAKKQFDQILSTFRFD